MAVTRHSLIAAEGKPFFFVLGILVALCFFWFKQWAALAVLPLLFVIWLFRDPHRLIPSAPLGVVSPVDGKVLSVTETHDPWLDRSAQKITLQMSPFGVNSLRSITEGKIMNYWRGREHKDERAIHIQTDEHDDVIIVLRPGRWLHRLSCHVVTGDRVGQGQRCGHILFGSRVDVFLPTSTRISLQAGQPIQGGSELLGEFIHG